ncbi:DUF4256 domain-containing protein [uncultured Chryseobacterium sp.]|uniref:DUF4256 domain-containing protein n=1 Tax=uncultured Chryseobacterium sp. TaxID=259322 RepID=UPI0025F09A62|nr:DUF4256 domain-containing protein [uncultured Chryseobacterium sp.]
MSKNKLTQEQTDELLKILKIRFDENMNRHENLHWDDILKKLEENPDKLRALYEMENKLNILII